MEKVLREKLATLPMVQALFGWQAERMQQDDEAVRVSIRSQDGSSVATLTCDYLVGCDGAHSMIRPQIGIERSKQDYEQTMLLAVFRSSDLDERLKRFPMRSTYRVLRPELKG